MMEQQPAPGTVAVSGQRASFGEVVEPHLPWLYSLARGLVGADDAEDLLQECLVKAFRGWDELRDVQAVPAWLKTIALNSARDRHRRAAAGFQEEPLEDLGEDDDYSLYRTLADEDPLPYSDSLHLDFLASFEVEDVREVLDRLPPKYRIPLVLVHMYGYRTAEVAEQLDVPLGTLLSRLHRGRKRFERELWDYADERDLLAARAGAGP